MVDGVDRVDGEAGDSVENGIKNGVMDTCRGYRLADAGEVQMKYRSNSHE